MTPYDAYVMYLALKRHFSSDYDFVKYNGKVKVSTASFEKRRDRYQFHKLSKQPDPLGLALANIMESDSAWVGDLFDDQAQSIYRAMKKRRETMAYSFRTELSDLDDLQAAMKVTDGDHPILLKRYHQGKVSPETMVVLNDLGKIFPYWDSKIEDEYRWPVTRTKLENYKPFLPYDRDKYREIFEEISKS